MADGYFISPKESGQIEMLAGVYRRTMATTDEVMMCEFLIQRDSLVPEHSHGNDQVGYVVYGLLEMTVGGVTQIVAPGESYAVPGGVVHGARAIHDTLVIDSFSPPRNDYRTEAR